MTKIYPGSNDNHRFYQSQDKNLMILCNHGEKHWSSHRNYGFVSFADSAENAAKTLDAEIDESKTWKQQGAVWCLKDTPNKPKGE